jgi:queuine tRNA-ribosyltransferase catalytic subunit
MVCKNYTRAYLHALARKEQLGGQLLTYHNIAYQMRLMKDVRNSILDGSFPHFVQNFMQLQYPDGKYDGWVVDSLASVGIHLKTPLKKDETDKMDE